MRIGRGVLVYIREGRCRPVYALLHTLRASRMYTYRPSGHRPVGLPLCWPGISQPAGHSTMRAGERGRRPVVIGSSLSCASRTLAIVGNEGTGKGQGKGAARLSRQTDGLEGSGERKKEKEKEKERACFRLPSVRLFVRAAPFRPSRIMRYPSALLLHSPSGLS
ncbi:hypothetical protein MPH_07755 [Macrophomina phaseolina MS6]|uniref:Uncharacterized protein n=1 Tax=Macrophomina phaseolina (strain MS6) TaxID=1126212 RepID=K2RQQ3_MACPH|nr:hypothetical protein MPH_07755 [Macrophomina phaseolina MS6]